MSSVSTRGRRVEEFRSNRRPGDGGAGAPPSPGALAAFPSVTALAAALRRAGRPSLDGWTAAAAAIAALVAVPLATIVYRAADPADDTFRHLAATVLPVYVSNTLWLLLGVGIGTIVIGASTAWLVTMYRFPGRRMLSWALLLPLAVPGYVLAFVVTDQLEYAGPVQSALREGFGWTSPRDYRFPEIRSLGGAIVVLSLVLYPYVYLLARAAFVEQCYCLYEASRTLGRGPVRSFLRVALPMARPGIVVGVSLALMETLNELGTVEFFAVPTLTAGIFDVWLNMDSPAGASQLAIVLVALTLALLAVERRSRHRGRVHATTSRVRALPDHRLRRGAALAALTWCALPVVLGFGLPAGVLAGYAIAFHEVALGRDYLEFAGNSLRLALLAALVTSVLGLVLAYGVRLSRRPGMRGMAETATVGYAVPGAVLGVGLLYPFGAFDNAVDAVVREHLGLSTGLLLSGTVAGLVLGYSTRFMSLSYRTLAAGLERVTPSMEGASRTLGSGPGATLRRVHLPLIGPSLLVAGLLVFVDTMKELPLTLIMRPFDFETLATFVFQYASDELLEECAAGALTIVIAGILPVVIISRTITRSRPGHRRG